MWSDDVVLYVYSRDTLGSGYGIIIDGYANRTNESPQPYAVADVAVLFDGLVSFFIRVSRNSSYSN